MGAEIAPADSRGGRVLGWLGVLLVGLILAEAALRAFAALPTNVGRQLARFDLTLTVYEPYSRFGYRPRPGASESFPNGTRAHYNARRYRGPMVEPVKPAGVFRIILLGGSTAVGYGADDDSTIDAHLRRMLNARFPSGCFEVVNLALGGYDSYQDYERMRVEGTLLAPDVVIVHSGINDVRNAQFPTLSDTAPDPRTLLWQSQLRDVRGRDGNYAPNFWAQVKHYSYLARFPGFARSLLGTRQSLGTIQEARAYPAATEYFASNVKGTIDLALNLGAAVILSTPPSAIPIRNRPTDPVEKSYWIKDAATTEEYRRVLSARMDSIASVYAAAGRPVRHVSHHLQLPEFLDDAHLLSSGNRTVAEGLLEVVTPYVRERPHSGCDLTARTPR